MNKDTLKGHWKQLKGKIQEQWGKLTNDDVEQVAGEREQLIGRIQERYGRERDVVEKDIQAFIRRYTGL